MLVKPLPHLAQDIGKLLSLETNLYLTHCWPALSRRRAPLLNLQTTARLQSVQRQSGPEANTQRRLLPEPNERCEYVHMPTVAPLGASLAIAIRWEMPQGCEGP